jgi:hypothetical protein
MKKEFQMQTKFTGLAALCLLALAAAPARAATTGSANITIQGSIPTSVGITVVGSGSYNNLALTSAASDLQVAVVTEKSNDTAGYTVTMASANAGAFKNGALGTITYTAKYNGTAVTLSATPQTVTDTSSATALVNAAKNVSVSFAAQVPDSLVAGAYSDQLTFAIAAK